MAIKNQTLLVQDRQLWKWEKTSNKRSLKWVSKLVLTLICFLISATSLWAQQIYVLYFTDKANGNSFSVSNPVQFLSERSISRRTLHNIPVIEKDLPVKTSYLQALANTGAVILGQSKWLNAAIISADLATMSTVSSLTFIQNSAQLSLIKKPTTRASFNPYIQKTGLASVHSEFGVWTPMSRQTNISRLVNSTQGANNMLIAVIDAGYPNANLHSATRHLFDNSRVVDAWDFPSRNNNPYDDYFHGFQVLSVIAGNDSNTIKGPAYGAQYCLYKTEEISTERPVEMFYWVMAAERADSAGADLIQSSVGYSTFDNTNYDVPISTLNGRTTIITKGAQNVARVGMLLCNSAGNEGNDSFRRRLITAPSDADSILCVGAIDTSFNIANFSGRGPTTDGRIKPDVVAFGVGVPVASTSSSSGYSIDNGTSFATPYVCGMAAVAWQYAKSINPSYSAQQLIADIKASCKLPSGMVPDNTIGWGLPDLDRFARLITEVNEQKEAQDIILYPNPTADNFTIKSSFPDLQGLEIINNLSQVVNIVKLNMVSSYEMQTSQLAKGLYTVVIRTKEKTIVKRWIKN